jgi:hypothetical protein
LDVIIAELGCVSRLVPLAGVSRQVLKKTNPLCQQWV